MNITYIHHSGFLVETDRFYYLFDYEKGDLPQLDVTKPIFLLSSHSHGDHYNPEVFSLLRKAGMRTVRAVLSDDIEVPGDVDTLSVAAGSEYRLGDRQTLTTFLSTDLGVAFLLEEEDFLIYHAGDLNDWVWDEETEDYNREMTASYRSQIRLLSETLKGRKVHAAFVVLDPRQEKNYDRGMVHFLENIDTDLVYPMHYWDDPGIIGTFLKDHPEYASRIQKTE